MQGFYSRKKIREITADKADSTVWRWESVGNFPKRRQIGPNSVGWLATEVDAWIKTRPVSVPEKAEAENENIHSSKKK